MPRLYFQIRPSSPVDNRCVAEELRHTRWNRQRSDDALRLRVCIRTLFPTVWLVDVRVPQISDLAPSIATANRLCTDKGFILNNERNLLRRKNLFLDQRLFIIIPHDVRRNYTEVGVQSCQSDGVIMVPHESGRL